MVRVRYLGNALCLRNPIKIRMRGYACVSRFLASDEFKGHYLF